MSVTNVEGLIGPDCPRRLDLTTRWSPHSSLFVPSVAWTRRILEIESYWMRGKRRGIVVAETGGVLFRVPTICSARALISGVRMTRSSSLLWRWRGVLLVSALALAPVGFSFGVLVDA